MASQNGHSEVVAQLLASFSQLKDAVGVVRAFVAAALVMPEESLATLNTSMKHPPLKMPQEGQGEQGGAAHGPMDDFYNPPEIGTEGPLWNPKGP